MSELFKKYIRSTVIISDEALDKGLELFTPKSVSKHFRLVMASENSRYLYFINKGCIRTYYISTTGAEKTRFIAFEGIITGGLASFISQTPSLEFVETLEDTELLRISYADFYSLVNNYKEWKEFYLKLLEMAYIYQHRRIENLITLPAKERYETLLAQNPEYVLRLPNKILATYLNITQETLSRLKAS